ncbi:hypothetical protein H5P36_18920 [Bacillus sp. APMAM]|nr:hypothetical protein [Bacillus sp. APMAM]
MKKSIISIITAILLVLGSVLPVLAAENNVTLTVSTDKLDYVPGDTINVNGKVLKNGAAGKGTNPTLRFIGPDGNGKKSCQWSDSEIGSDGTITCKIVLGPDAMNGSYTIQVSAEYAAPQKIIVNVSGSTAVKTLSVKDLKENYKPGDKVDISGFVLLGSQGVNGDVITINILKDNKDLSGSPLTIKSVASGSFASSYTLPKNAVAGTYTVKVAASGVDQPVNKTFTVLANTTDPGSGTGTDPGTGGPGSGTGTDPGTGGPGSGTGTDPGTGGPGSGTEPPGPVPDLKEGPVLNPVTSEDLVITGSAENGVFVNITDKKNLKLSAPIAANKSFTIKLTQKIKEGTKLYATETDERGKVISKVTEWMVVDKTSPAAPSVNTVSDRDKKVTGKTEAGAKVIIKVGKKSLGSKTADKKGNFSVSIKVQKAGTKLEVTATDKEGNTSKVTKVTVKDKTPPSVPTVSKVKPTSTTITGKAEAGAKVYVKAGKNIIGTATVGQKGSYSVKIKKQKRGTVLYVYAIDKAGNVGDSKKVSIK